MATQTLADQDLTGAWVDLTVALAGLISVNSTIQNVGPGRVAICWGNDPADGLRSGLVLDPLAATTGIAAHVYARSLGSSGRVSVLLT